MTGDVKPKLRISAYVDKFDPPDKDRGAIDWLMIESTRGFWLDVTVEVEGVRGTVILDHIGDGKVYKTLEEAEEVVLRETGIHLECLPEQPNESGWTCVAYFVGEFEMTNKPEAEILAESIMPPRNPDRSRRTQ